MEIKSKSQLCDKSLACDLTTQRRLISFRLDIPYPEVCLLADGGFILAIRNVVPDLLRKSRWDFILEIADCGLPTHARM